MLKSDASGLTNDPSKPRLVASARQCSEGWSTSAPRSRDHHLQRHEIRSNFELQKGGVEETDTVKLEKLVGLAAKSKRSSEFQKVRKLDTVF